MSAATPEAAVPAPDSWRGDPAGFASRAAAFTIDAIIISTVVSAGLYAVGAVADVLDTDQAARASELASALSLTVAVAVTAFAYFTAGFWLFGRTVGKLALGLRVVRRDGGRPHLGQSAWRTFCYGISSFLMLGFLAITVSRQRRAWHDHLARTSVVYDWAAHPRVGALDDGEPLPPHRLP